MAGEPLSFRAFLAARPAGCEYGYGHGHGHGDRDGLSALRDREFPRLRGITYLDHAGSALFPESLLKAFTDDLRNNIYGNPHSQNISSKLTYDTIEHVRYRILQHFHTTAEDYTIIFTSGCTAALKLIAESFPWIPEGTKQPSSRFCYLTDSHTSVVGMRGITASMNVLSVPIKPKEILLAKSRLPAEEQNCTTPHLFSYPAQSNFSGTKYPLSWIQDIKSGRLCPIKLPGKWFVLLDAASYVSSSPLDLGVHQADFIPISFYKIFGFPTGLGALLVNNRIAPLLRKTYFGGGTAAAYLAGEDFYFPRKSIAERFEDGTVSFLDIIALKHGFDVLEKLTGGMEKIKQHTFALAHYTYTVLSNLKYANGAPVVRIYSDTDFSSPDVQGPIINFNVLDENGQVLGFSQVDSMASLHNIHVRTGCFCNTGACQMHLDISNEDIQRNLQAGHVCGDNIDLVDGRPTGSVRISFGYMSSFEDAQTFLNFIIATRLSNSVAEIPLQSVTKLTTESVPDDHLSFNKADKLSPILQISDGELGNIPSEAETTGSWQPPEPEAESMRAAVSETAVPMCRKGGKPITVAKIYLYPIKSCSAFEVTEWPVGNQGLLYDRNWMVVNQNGVCMTQKQEPRLCLVNPSIDLKQKMMVIQAEGMDPISVPLEDNTGKEAVICESKVCSHRVKTYDCGEKIAGWLSMFLGCPCRLIRQSSGVKSKSHQKNTKGLSSATNISLSLVNEAQYLLINVASILQLKEHISASTTRLVICFSSEEAPDVARTVMVTEKHLASHSAVLKEPLEIEELIRRFRANIVISAPESFEEEEWAEISIGALQFQVVGPCSRCQIICIDQQSGERNKEILQSLSAARGRKTNFGIYLMNQPLCSSFSDTLSVGSQVLPVLKENTEIQPPISSEEKCSG
ncbi:molybdenum cofactor sulfurase isoform X2 [Passer montanus]|uniref:molybdenum cofactor sulfurase isoform X2 n=1 Tax=Passer montanus TaxID=9160 RepID=UPI00196205E5|nr:molybdenum cofactor sulfurase isoform X2 [Passer montanus]